MTTTQRIFDPCVAAGNDGWTEIATTVGVHQPPNRVLPAPIFRDVAGPNAFYSPHNGATGNWAISKTVVSGVAGPGQLVLYAGTYPCTGGLYADDQVASVRVNGTQVPFTYGGVVAGPAIGPVVWLAGNNTVEIEIANTVAGNTSFGGLMDAVIPTSTSPLPCDCCNPDTACRIVTSEILLDAPEAIITNGTGTPILPLSRWSDGDITGVNFTGWTSPGIQYTAATSPVIDLSFVVPQNGITGIREWNQGGGDLNDSDGFASWDYAVFDNGGNVMLTGNMVMGNGGAPFTHTFPAPLNGVKRIRLSNIRKILPGGGVTPLTREVRMLQTVYSTVFRCRDAQNGVVSWYDIDGNLVPNGQVGPCPNVQNVLAPLTPIAPFVPPTGQRLSTSFMGDDGGTGENLCNVVPPPTSTIGFTLVGSCYDPVPNAIMDWIPGTSSIQMTYDSHASAASGASLFNWFVTSAGGFYTWAANATPMVPGEQRVSNPNADGSFIRATQLPFTGPANGALRMDGGANLRIGPAVVSNFGAYPMLFEWFI